MLALGVTLMSAASGQAATPPLHPLGTSSSVVQSDGVRYAAYKPRPDQLVLFDDATGVSTPLSDFGRCDPLWGSAGYFLVLCPAHPGAFVLNAATRTLLPIADYGSSWDQYTGFIRIGVYWVEAETSTAGPSGGESCWVFNWRTGGPKRYVECGIFEPVIPEPPRDFDSPTLRRLGPIVNFVAPAFAEGRYVVRQAATPRGSRGHPLRLYRRGRRVALLDRCLPSCTSVQLGAGRVTWSRGGLAFAYDVGTRKRLHWRLPRVEGLARGVQHTRRHVFFSLTSSSYPDPFQASLYSAAWPR